MSAGDKRAAMRPVAELRWIGTCDVLQPTVWVDSDEVSFGRSADSKVVLYDARLADRQKAAVSRNHCILKWDPDSCAFFMTDLGSTNGTFVNGYRLRKDTPHELIHGCTITLGGSCKVPQGQSVPSDVKLLRSFEWKLHVFGSPEKRLKSAISQAATPSSAGVASPAPSGVGAPLVGEAIAAAVAVAPLGEAVRRAPSSALREANAGDRLVAAYVSPSEEQGERLLQAPQDAGCAGNAVTKGHAPLVAAPVVGDAMLHAAMDDEGTGAALGVEEAAAMDIADSALASATGALPSSFVGEGHQDAHCETDAPPPAGASSVAAAAISPPSPVSSLSPHPSHGEHPVASVDADCSSHSEAVQLQQQQLDVAQSEPPTAQQQLECATELPACAAVSASDASQHEAVSLSLGNCLEQRVAVSQSLGNGSSSGAGCEEDGEEAPHPITDTSLPFSQSTQAPSAPPSDACIKSPSAACVEQLGSSLVLPHSSPARPAAAAASVEEAAADYDDQAGAAAATGADENTGRPADSAVALGEGSFSPLVDSTSRGDGFSATYSPMQHSGAALVDVSAAAAAADEGEIAAAPAATADEGSTCSGTSDSASNCTTREAAEGGSSCASDIDDTFRARDIDDDVMECNHAATDADAVTTDDDASFMSPLKQAQTTHLSAAPAQSSPSLSASPAAAAAASQHAEMTQSPLAGAAVQTVAADCQSSHATTAAAASASPPAETYATVGAAAEEEMAMLLLPPSPSSEPAASAVDAEVEAAEPVPQVDASPADAPAAVAFDAPDAAWTSHGSASSPSSLVLHRVADDSEGVCTGAAAAMEEVEVTADCDVTDAALRAAEECAQQRALYEEALAWEEAKDAAALPSSASSPAAATTATTTAGLATDLETTAGSPSVLHPAGLAFDDVMDAAEVDAQQQLPQAPSPHPASAPAAPSPRPRSAFEAPSPHPALAPENGDADYCDGAPASGSSGCDDAHTPAVCVSPLVSAAPSAAPSAPAPNDGGASGVGGASAVGGDGWASPPPATASATIGEANAVTPVAATAATAGEASAESDDSATPVGAAVAAPSTAGAAVIDDATVTRESPQIMEEEEAETVPVDLMVATSSVGDTHFDVMLHPLPNTAATASPAPTAAVHSMEAAEAALPSIAPAPVEAVTGLAAHLRCGFCSAIPCTPPPGAAASAAPSAALLHCGHVACWGCLATALEELLNTPPPVAGGSSSTSVEPVAACKQCGATSARQSAALAQFGEVVGGALMRSVAEGKTVIRCVAEALAERTGIRSPAIDALLRMIHAE